MRAHPLSLLLVVTALWFHPAPARQATVLTAGEYEVRAAYLYNFAKFVQWPGNPPDDELTVCVIGVDPFGSALDAIVGQPVGSRRVGVRRLQWQDPADACQVAYISWSEEPRLKQLLARLRDLPLLTVSDIPGFVARGGMIMFHRQGKKVRFAINPEPTHHVGLKISGHLMRLAREATRSGDQAP